MSTQPAAAPANLRAAKRQQAAAKRPAAAKPAGSKATPKAKAKASGKATNNLRWVMAEKRDARGLAPATAVSPVTGATYQIDGSGTNLDGERYAAWRQADRPRQARCQLWRCVHQLHPAPRPQGHPHGHPQGSGVIAALAVAAGGLMAACLAIGYGIHRATRTPKA